MGGRIIIIYLYGVAGAGKTYIGKILADSFGFTSINADMWIAEDILSEFKAQGEFTQESRDKLHAVIADKISQLPDDSPIVIAQASLKAVNRAQILEKNSDVLMIHVYAATETLLKRVTARGNFVTPENVETMLNNFDAPEHEESLAIDNSDSPAVPLLEQINAILDTLSVTQSPKLKSRMR